MQFAANAWGKMPQMSVYSLGLQSEQLSNIDSKILNISAI